MTPKQYHTAPGFTLKPSDMRSILRDQADR
jgi:hypothetical protein